MKKQTSLAFSAALMGVIILLSKIMGLLRDILVASGFGTTEAAVAYETASKLPVTIFDLVLGGVVTAAFIPIYNSLAVKGSKKEAMAFASSYVNLVLLITGGLAVLGCVFAPQLVRFMAPELSSSALELATELTRIMFPMVIAVGLAFSFVGFLQSEGEYNVPALISLISNLIMVGYLCFFKDRFGIHGLAVAMLVGWAAQAVVQIPSLIKHGFVYRPLSPVTTPEMGRAVKNSLPILLATWVTPVCNLLNTRIASGIEEGRAITALGYANRLYIILVGVFSFVATNLLFPHFAKAAARGQQAESDRLTRTSVKILTYILAPISVGIAVLSEPFVALIYQRGSFTAADTTLTAEALGCYAAGMIFAAITEVLTKAFFAIEKNKIPMTAALLSLGVNAILLFLLGDRLQVGGIALLTALSAGVNMAVNLFFALRYKMVTPTRADLRDLLRSLLCAAGMGVGVYGIGRLTRSLPSLLSFGLSVLGGVLLYALLTALCRSEETLGLWNTLRGKLRSRKK